MSKSNNILVDIEEGADGLYGVRVIDLENGAIWWETICETHEDAVAAVKSIYETPFKKMQNNLQSKLWRARVK